MRNRYRYSCDDCRNEALTVIHEDAVRFFYSNRTQTKRSFFDAAVAVLHRFCLVYCSVWKFSLPHKHAITPQHTITTQTNICMCVYVSLGIYFIGMSVLFSQCYNITSKTHAKLYCAIFVHIKPGPYSNLCMQIFDSSHYK